MDDALLMGDVNGPRQQQHQPGRLARGLRLVAQLAVQVPALDELHREPGPGAVLPAGVHLHDVGMVHLGQQLRLGQQARPALARARQAHALEGLDAVEVEVAHLEHDPHAALPQLLQQLVAGHVGPLPVLGRRLRPEVRRHGRHAGQLGRGGLQRSKRADRGRRGRADLGDRVQAGRTPQGVPRELLRAPTVQAPRRQVFDPGLLLANCHARSPPTPSFSSRRTAARTFSCTLHR